MCANIKKMKFELTFSNIRHLFVDLICKPRWCSSIKIAFFLLFHFPNVQWSHQQKWVALVLPLNVHDSNWKLMKIFYFQMFNLLKWQLSVCLYASIFLSQQMQWDVWLLDLAVKMKKQKKTLNLVCEGSTANFWDYL